VIHAKELIDRLGSLPALEFGGEVFRTTRRGLDPLTASTRGGRWSPKEELGGTESVATLYTSLTKEGSLAEMAFHYAQLTPFPSKPVLLHSLRVTTERTLRLLQSDLTKLGVEWPRYGELDYEATQKIGAAVAFLGCDGLIAPSARWKCENLMLFATNLSLQNDLRVLKTEEIGLRDWALTNHFLEGDPQSP